MVNKEYDFSKYKNEEYMEFYTVSDVYKTVDTAEGEDYVLVKKDVKCKEKVWKAEITYIREVVNTQGNIRRQRTEIGLRYKDPIIVLGRYRDINDVVFTTSSNYKNIGFKFY